MSRLKLNLHRRSTIERSSCADGFSNVGQFDRRPVGANLVKPLAFPAGVLVVRRRRATAPRFDLGCLRLRMWRLAVLIGLSYSRLATTAAFTLGRSSWRPLWWSEWGASSGDIRVPHSPIAAVALFYG